MGVATVVITSVLAACGGGGSSAAPDDAKAACAALSRTKTHLAKPSVADIKRVSAAANLGTAAASESRKYVNLNAPMSAVQADVQNSDIAKLVTDARAALSVCSDLNLPH
jgi:hypothetical protein